MRTLERLLKIYIEIILQIFPCYTLLSLLPANPTRLQYAIQIINRTKSKRIQINVKKIIF